MMDTAKKVFKKIIRTTLKLVIQDAGDLSSKRLRPGGCTIDDILKVTEAVKIMLDYDHICGRVALDVRNPSILLDSAIR